MGNNEKTPIGIVSGWELYAACVFSYENRCGKWLVLHKFVDKCGELFSLFWGNRIPDIVDFSIHKDSEC